MKKLLISLIFAVPLIAGGAYTVTPAFCRGSVCDTDTVLYRLFASPDMSGFAFRFAVLLFLAASAFIAYLIVLKSDD